MRKVQYFLLSMESRNYQATLLALTQIFRSQHPRNLLSVYENIPKTKSLVKCEMPGDYVEHLLPEGAVLRTFGPGDDDERAAAVSGPEWQSE